MRFVDRVVSKVDNVVKYVFRQGNTYEVEHDKYSHLIEFSYIDNGTGKDIVCVSCQSMCNMGCKFCHCTDYVGKIPVRNIPALDIMWGIDFVVKDIGIKNPTLLISFMGCGEPFNTGNPDVVIDTMLLTQRWNNFEKLYDVVRFGVATCLPKNRVDRFFKFCQQVKDNNLPVKLHLSLHYTKEFHRNQWMPNSLDIKSSIAACNFFRQYTGNKVEVHYTLIEGINDRSQDRDRLARLLRGTDFDIKLITYNEKETIPYKQNSHPESWRYWLALALGPGHGNTEVYTPPGRDVGASCGQFMFEDYDKYLPERHSNVQIIY